MRYAIYYTPAPDDALACTAASWLGRDPFTGAMKPAVAVGTLTAAEVAFHTASARRYGFHATLKAPFWLAEGESEDRLCQALATYAESVSAVVLPRLVVGQIDGFLALVSEAPSPELHQFAGDIVAAFDRFRAPLSEQEIARRNPDTLSPAEVRNLCQWGYPHVFDSFRFHMTLTGRLTAEQSPRLRGAIAEIFAQALAEPFSVDGLALFVEPEPGAPFTVHSYHALGRSSDRKIA
ncbi:DUF1045 domain-containing protein [Pseudaminobacter arsenicus]|uniref:DUF1045 domain-containing protein n=1 Tax=Borborobacter arsenicus TaxID=1851146 RepID=A0A432V8R8_9HYPH|nr:DUF1045 domain-containing protein [Pseudaminobacter arsenicus]RUM98536.1 DUF1045 domain-containing protein [Pseudaminobacter arsenicus]